MGIRSLQTYIDEECPQALVPANIASCAARYKEQTQSDPLLLIDSFSCAAFFYESIRSDGLHLGQYEELLEQILLLIRVLRDRNIKFIFYFDGSPPEKREPFWITRRTRDGNRLTEAVDLLRNENYWDAIELMKECVEKGGYVKYAVRLAKCELMQTIKEADDEIMECIATKHCFGVLAQDTDFVIMEGIENYFSVKELHIRSLNTKVYRRSVLAHNLGIDERFLPLFATLSGNDNLTDAELRNFHLMLLQDHPDYGRLCMAKFLPKRLIIPRVGSWIRRNSSSMRNQSTVPRIAADLIGMPDLEEKVHESIQSYLLPNRPAERRRNDVGEEWEDILEVAEKRHRKLGVHNSILTIMTRSKFYQGCSVEVFNHPTFPTSGILHRELRRRFYGILLKERPRDLGIVVTELVLCGHNSLVPAVKVTANMPTYHPGLLRLWGSCAEDEKLKILCWVVSKKLTAQAILQLHPHIRLACVSLFYLVHEVNSGMKRWQVEALVAYLVCQLESATDKFKKLKCGLPDIIEVHIGSVYKATWRIVLAIDDACGNPLMNKVKNVFFDGKVFNYIYNYASKGTPSSNLCNKLIFNNIIKFLYQ